MGKSYLLILLVIIPLSMFSQEANYDENKVPDYVLPQLLQLKNGREVKTSRSWMKKRRPEILADFEKEMYGRVPGKLKISSSKILEQSASAFGGKATRKQVELTFKKNGKKLNIGLLLYIPNMDKPAHLFLGYNFIGNHTVYDDPEIFLTESWVRDDPSLGIINNQVTEQSRGDRDDRWVVEKLIDSGFGLATVYYGDVDPDKDDYSDGIHPFFYKENQKKPASDEWGSIAAWAWGLSRVMDYLEMDKNVDSKKVIVIGHSLLGKTALWAGALDQRFAAVISNESGCGGAALSRRAFGETITRINKSFPHWFCGNFKKYGNHESNLPFDQHELIALIAPRPVYIASAAEDLWSDPKGEFLAGYFATPVYNLFGFEGINQSEMPTVNNPVMNRIGYHIRSGKHDITNYDWEQYIQFVKNQLK